MKWTAIDFGHAVIKAAVCGDSNKPEKLMYNEGMSYSYMPCVAVVADDEVFIGHQVLLLEAMGVEGIVTRLNGNPHKEKIIKKIFSVIKESSADFYAETAIGAVLVFDDASSKKNVEKAIQKIKEKRGNGDDVMAKSAMDVFSEVNCVCASEVISSIYGFNRGVTVVVDWGYTSLKVSIVDNGEQKSYNLSEQLGFGTVDLSDIVGYDFTADISNAEHTLCGMYLKEVVRRNLNLNADHYYPLPIFKDMIKGKGEIQKRFDEEMVRYLYKCFDYCSEAIRKSEWNWSDIGSIIFCGGGANYYSLPQVFENYQKSYGIKKDITVKAFGKDAEWISAYSAMQLPLERNASTVIIEY